ncbi:hypothetical protein NMY22_g14626 [Coprinellus aureogranulatus]|nr:hypothetical protein NMY22_g14626 [Coprinellus aureogranulatus]
MASKKVEIVVGIIRIGLRQKRGIRHMLGQCIKAAEGLYRPKSYEEEYSMRGLVLWRLGGDRIAAIANRALGLPSITTLRNQTRIQPIVPSPGQPKVEKVTGNIENTFDSEGLLGSLKPGPGARNRHAVAMFDKIATEKRLRWYSRTNKFLGVCCQHGNRVALDFNSERDMKELFRAFDEREVHVGMGTTVGAMSVLSDDYQIYALRVVLLSSDCKREDGTEHAQVLQTTVDGINPHKDTTNIQLVSIASDDETRRGSALVQLTFKKTLSPSSDIYPLLSPLPFMNLHVGDDDLTVDKDWKHFFEGMRNLPLQAQGIVVCDTRIAPSILDAHLIEAGMDASHTWEIMTRNDKQDVLLAYELLKSIWSLPRLTKKQNPSFISARYVLTGGKECIPMLLFVDLMAMIKNIYFCVAKAKTCV